MSKKYYSIDDFIKNLKNKIKKRGYDSEAVLSSIDNEISILEVKTKESLRILERINKNIDRALSPDSALDKSDLEQLHNDRKEIRIIISQLESGKIDLQNFKVSFHNNFRKSESSDSKNIKIGKINLGHINWYKKDSLKPFINELKKNKLIKSRESEAIIKDHFKLDREQNREPEPIQWLDDNRFLAYLFDRLIEENYISVHSSKHKLLASHFINKHGDSLNPSSLSSQLSTLKKGNPLKHKSVQVIEKIIRELPDSNY